ncbi:MAG: acyl-ACP--UDP-N-acetylglucosamine O-acyltransferase [Acidobacteriota bacterium]|nr:MAG: acyl-ACP--UDP-N-acetylglucosamine O-acyltransferase [Acidobacteriota bacterium]
MKRFDPERVHPTAIISPEARLADDVRVGAYSIIGDRVEIGAGTVIGPQCRIEGPTVIGQGNQIYGQASVGTDPQDLKFAGEDTFLFIGDRNKIREFVTINRGTVGGGARTTLGSDNLLMTQVHIAHDCHVGDRVILANAATLAGHVEVASDSTVGAFCGVHQFCRVGVHAFIGGYSVVTRDVVPFLKTVGIRNDAKTYGVNSIGLERKGFSKEEVEALNKAYRTIFRKGLRLTEAISQVREGGVTTDGVRVLIEFLESSERGFIR